MALEYKVVSTNKPGTGKDGEQIWFPKLTGTSQVDIYEVGRILEKRSTASAGDVCLIIEGLVSLLPDLLAEGRTIKLNRLGTFRLHAKVETSDSPEKVTVKNIKEIRLSFRPAKEIKEALQNIKIERKD